MMRIPAEKGEETLFFFHDCESDQVKMLWRQFLCHKMYVGQSGCHLFLLESRLMNTVVTQMTRGDMFRKTMNIILLHQSSRQDYLNTITHLQEKTKV